MLKVEFEKMIGKEVDYDTFRVYEDMYTSLPESYTKQDFVAMLNIEAIPESAAAIERKAARAEFVEGIKKQIRDKKEMIELEKHTLEIDEEIAKDNPEYKNYVRAGKNFIKRLRAEIAELKWLIA